MKHSKSSPLLLKHWCMFMSLKSQKWHSQFYSKIQKQSLTSTKINYQTCWSFSQSSMSKILKEANPSKLTNTQLKDFSMSQVP